MNRVLTVALALVASLVALSAPAYGGSCSDASAPAAESALQLDVPESPAGAAATYYVALESGSVWQETNGYAGLQSAAGKCAHKFTGKPVGYDADTAVTLA